MWERPPCTRRRTRATAPDKEDPPPPTPLVSTVQGYMRKRSRTHEGAHARTHTLCAGTEPRESFLTPTHDEGGGEGKGL